MEIVLEVLFLTLSKVKVEFVERELIKKAYTIAKVLSITKKVQIITPKNFAKAALDLKQKAFIIYVATFF